MAKFEQKREARRLRYEGLSVKNIASKLDVSVSSVSNWVRDVQLSPEQMKVLEANAKNPFYGKRLDYINRIKKETDLKVETLKKEGISEIGVLSKRELFLIGVGLYWSEGFKKDSQVGFANSDLSMINLFIRWLKECFGYKNEDLILRVTLNISHKERIKEIEDFWSIGTQIPLENFRKPFYQSFLWKKTYENPNEYFGLLRVKVRKSKDFLRKIHGFIEGMRLQSEIVQSKLGQMSMK